MSPLTGTWRVTRLALRTDRLALPAWILGLGLFVAATAGMFLSSLAAHADLVRETRLVATSAGMRLLGLTSGPSIGGYLLHREFVTLAVLAAVMSTLTVVRHTRQSEELGREELVASTVVGRYAGLTAAVLVALATDVGLAVVLAAAIVVTGLPTGGAVLAGASVGAVGAVFTGVAAVCCQLHSTTRGAIGAASAVLGVSFAVSGVGNMLGTVDPSGLRVESAWPVWLSPLGWGQQMRPFGGGHLWPLSLVAVTTVALVGVAFVLAGRRDVGAGMWPERSGHVRAPRSLLSPTGLAWRLQRGVLTGWAVALLGFGLIFGALTEQIQHVHGSAADWYTRTGGSDQVLDAYRASIIAMAGMFVAVYVVQVLLRMRTDEAGGTLEPMLAAGVTRSRWMLAHALNAAAGAVVLVVLFAAGMGVTAGLALGHVGTELPRLVGAGLVQLSGVLVLGAAVVAVVGLAPRWCVPVSWALLVATFALGPMFGTTLGLPQWLQDLSPFTHVPKVPAATLTAAPLGGLLAVCALLAVVGVVAIRRRDLVLPA